MVKPQQPQRLEDGKNWSIATTLRPARSPLYCSWRPVHPGSRLLSLWTDSGCGTCFSP